MEESTVDSEIRIIRDMLNEGVFIHNLERFGFEWDMTCASMDMVEDSQLAVEAFGGMCNSYGQRYLEVYGLFQAFFLQQDALKNLSDSLGLSSIDLFEDPGMSTVRVLRNKYFGHPSKRDRPGPTSYHGLSRFTVINDEITGWTYPGFETETISVKAMMENQARGAIRVFGQMRQELESKRKDYIMKFAGKELPINDHVYEFEKLNMWALRPDGDDAVMAKAAHEILSQTLEQMKVGIEERYANTQHIGDVMRTIEKAEYCLSHIRESMTRGGSNGFEDEIHMDALEHAYGEIVSICKEINQVFKTS